MIRRPRRRTPPSARPRVELLENREALTSLAGPPASFFLGPTPPPSPPTIDGRSMVSSRAVVDATTATIRIAPLADAPIVVEAAQLTPSTSTTNPPVVRTDLFGVAGPAILAGDLEFGADVPRLDYRSRSPDPAPLPCADRRWSEPPRLLAAPSPGVAAPVFEAETAPVPVRAAVTAPPVPPARDASASMPLLTGLLGIAALIALRYEPKRARRLVFFGGAARPVV